MTESKRDLGGVRSFFKKLFCLHASWAQAGWKPLRAMTGDNWYVCKSCGKLRNFGFKSYGHLGLPNLPVNFDCVYETCQMPKEDR